MGVTKYDTDLLASVVNQLKPRNVIELGAQYLYDTPEHCLNAVNNKPTYAKEWFEIREIKHLSIDLNGEADIQQDLTHPPETWATFPEPADLVTDFGTAEHTTDLYMTLLNIHEMTQTGGGMIHANPEVGSWPKHGNWYFTTQFWKEVCEACKYKIIQLNRHPAMGNDIDGWNVYLYCIKTPESEFNLPPQIEETIRGYKLK